MIPASDDRGLSKNTVYYFAWQDRGLEDYEDDLGGWEFEGHGGGWGHCLCKWDMVESVNEHNGEADPY